MVVHAAGRVPEIDDLNIDAAGVEWDERGAKGNEFLQSVLNPSVYAAGDAAASGGPQLTPVASHDSRIVATNLLKGNHRKPQLPRRSDSGLYHSSPSHCGTRRTRGAQPRFEVPGQKRDKSISWKPAGQEYLLLGMFQGSMKRVASAVGEGAMVVAFVHDYFRNV